MDTARMSDAKGLPDSLLSSDSCDAYLVPRALT